VNICEDFIVEHEGEALLDGGLGGLPVVERAGALVHVSHEAGVPAPVCTQESNLILGLLTYVLQQHIGPKLKHTLDGVLDPKLQITDPEPQIETQEFRIRILK